VNPWWRVVEFLVIPWRIVVEFLVIPWPPAAAQAFERPERGKPVLRNLHKNWRFQVWKFRIACKT
jgi:hypothetical protein